MKIHATITLLAILISNAFAGESSLTTTFQPLAGLAAGRIIVTSVTCHHWYSSSASSAVDLICVKNVPPTDNPKEANEDLNMASVCGLKFRTNDLGALNSIPKIEFDATRFVIPKRFTGYSREEIIRACLECLRRCAPNQISKTPVTLKSLNKDKGWLEPIIREFNAHDRSKVFYPVKSESKKSS